MHLFQGDDSYPLHDDYKVGNNSFSDTVKNSRNTVGRQAEAWGAARQAREDSGQIMRPKARYQSGQMGARQRGRL